MKLLVTLRRGNAATAAVNVAFAGDAAKEKVKSTAATVKKRVTDAPKVAKRSIKDRIKKGALAVKRMSEEKQDLQELPIIPVAAGEALEPCCTHDCCY